MRLAPTSLRRRLVLATIALVAVGSILVGVVSVVALRGFLVDRLDTQLLSAADRSHRVLDGDGADREDIERVLGGLGAGSLAVAFADGRLVGGWYTTTMGESARLSVSQLALLEAVPGGAAPHRVDLGGDLGAYRVIGVGDGPATIVVGLPMREADGITADLISVVAVISLIVLAVAGAACAVIVRLSLRPLDRVAATATRVAELPLERGDVALPDRVPASDADPTTEAGRVGAALNRMLDHVEHALLAREESERTVRRFVADASHELRTPLAAIRGYAELTRRAPFDLPDDTRYSISRIESESVRMTRLVEELLLLARLDEGRALEREPVELRSLLADVVSDAEAASPDHEWVRRLGDEAVVVEGDRARLHQVVANLLGNARTHTPPGTRVVVSLSRDGEHAVVGVEDDGPGVPEGVRATLFERFVRADSARSTEAGSTGLGLAIVLAIVSAHGGSVEVESEPGRTRFEVRLPTAPQPAR